MVYLTFSDTITYEVFEFEQLPETFSNFTIFFIADIHRRKVNIKTLLKVKERIDLVMIGGDLVERGVPLKRMQENIRLLKHWKVPIFFVWGNNDYEVDIEEMTEILHEEKVIVLKDSYVKMKREIDEINIIGLDYDENFKKFPNVNWNNIDESFTLLLTHHPVSFYELDEQMKQKVDLVLAGHTHGGQIRFLHLVYIRKAVFITTQIYRYLLQKDTAIRYYHFGFKRMLNVMLLSYKKRYKK